MDFLTSLIGFSAFPGHLLSPEYSDSTVFFLLPCDSLKKNSQVRTLQHLIIPLLCHFTIKGQQKVQNMPCITLYNPR